jgi:hypothetical protein
MARMAEKRITCKQFHQNILFVQSGDRHIRLFPLPTIISCTEPNELGFKNHHHMFETISKPYKHNMEHTRGKRNGRDQFLSNIRNMIFLI